MLWVNVVEPFWNSKNRLKGVMKMKVLHVLSSDDKYGSAQCFIELLKQELDDGKVEPVVITPKANDINTICNELGVTNYCIEYNQFQIPKHDIWPVFILKYVYHFLCYYLHNFMAEKKVISLVEKHNIDVIHTNSCVVDLGSTVARKTGRINIWHLREFGREDFCFYSIKRSYINKMNEQQNIFIAISSAVRKTWTEKGIDSQRTYMLYDGVDRTRFNGECVPKMGTKKIKFVMCGSFCEAKNQRLLVEALHQLPNEIISTIQVDFYGKKEGAYFEEISKLVKEYHLDEIVRFMGFANNIPLVLKKYDVGVMCSRAEAFGRVTVEYMFAGLCPLVPETGANYEIIVENQCGLTYEESNAVALCEAIKRICQGDIDLTHYARKANKVALEKYDINKNAKSIIRLFKDFAK